MQQIIIFNRLFVFFPSFQMKSNWFFLFLLLYIFVFYINVIYIYNLILIFKNIFFVSIFCQSLSLSFDCAVSLSEQFDIISLTQVNLHISIIYYARVCFLKTEILESLEWIEETLLFSSHILPLLLYRCELLTAPSCHVAGKQNSERNAHKSGR